MSAGLVPRRTLMVAQCWQELGAWRAVEFRRLTASLVDEENVPLRRWQALHPSGHAPNRLDALRSSCAHRSAVARLCSVRRRP